MILCCILKIMCETVIVSVKFISDSSKHCKKLALERGYEFDYIEYHWSDTFYSWPDF